MNDFRISYAQNREDVVIDAFFPDIKKGFYIDVGANHPHYHSVTKLFYDKGWRGVNFEPNPMLFKQIQEHRPYDTNLMQGVADKEGSFDLRVYHSQDGLEGISTMSQEMKNDYQAHVSNDNKDFTDLKVRVVTLKDVLSKVRPKHIHFMKIDVEGFEYEVLKGNDWKLYRPELICIESNHIMKDWRPILQRADYSLVFNDGLNDYYLASESKKRAKYFDYAKVFLNDKPVLGFEVAEQLRSVTERANTQAKAFNIQIMSKQEQIDSLQAYINEITPLKKHLKRQIKIRTSKLKGKTKK